MCDEWTLLGGGVMLESNSVATNSFTCENYHLASLASNGTLVLK